MSSSQKIDLRQVLMEGARERLRSLGTADRHEALLVVHSLHANATAAGLTDLLPLLGQLEGEILEGRPYAVERVREAIRAHLEALSQQDAEVDDDVLECFTEESSEHLDTIRRQLGRLAKGPDARDALEETFRALHTFKGAAAMVGQAEAARVAHRLEDLLQESLRSGLRCDPACLSRLADGLRELEGLVDTCKTPEGGPLSDPSLPSGEGWGGGDREINRDLSKDTDDSAEAPLPVSSVGPSGDPSLFSPREGRGEGADSDGSVLRTPLPRGARHETTAIVRVPLVYASEMLAAVGDIRETSARAARAARAIIEVQGELSEIHRELVALCDREPAAIPLALRLGRAAPDLERAADELDRHIATMGRATRTTQVLAKRLTTATAGWVFKRLEAAAEDVARQLGRRMVIERHGESIELDRKLAGWVLDPLLHIVRNAVAHGIEAPAQRVALGKKTGGRLRLEAEVVGEAVEFTVEDDGVGIDLEPVRQVLVERGHRTAAGAARASREELLEAIFLPGLSTRAEADELAGRGMGLNAVRAEVERRGGEVSVETWAGRGTRFVVRAPTLPETRKVTVVHIDGMALGLLSNQIKGVTLDAPKKVKPLALDESLGLASPDGDRDHTILLAGGREVRSLRVEHIEGERNILFSPLGWGEGHLGPYLGIGVVAEDEVIPILNLAALIDSTGDAPSPKPPRALLAEDSPTARSKISAALAEAGIEVEPTADGLEAWTRLCCESFDLLVTDLEMPRLHGFELIERLRAEPHLARIPVVVLTSNRDDSLLRRIGELQVRELVFKQQGDSSLVEAALRALGSVEKFDRSEETPRPPDRKRRAWHIDESSEEP